MSSVESVSRAAWLNRLRQRGADDALKEFRVRPRKRGQPTGRSLSNAVTDVLSNRIKVTFTQTPKRMSGYDAIMLVLRDRAVRGDATARQLLTDLIKYAGAALAGASDGGEPSAGLTSPEQDLDQAFAERARIRPRAEENTDPYANAAAARVGAKQG